VLPHCYFSLAEQPIPGPHPGDGKLDVAERWLTVTFDLEEENEAAAAPATITDNAKILAASFISSYPLSEFLDTKNSLSNTKDTSADSAASPSISVSSISSHRQWY
jgi:hypothetical protein